ncbi:hypothetical protein C7N43_36575 [Sphingobacteriales bacterium UPWRP_1]|nr:hypothetical protein B6N25_00625 [Sphingobacteriales bacterium TSM_CSS]PSJ71986.1 hypothetical protein C7N43_36575 [Sphingobacteriales bacterium UPWRP_1]
MRPKTKKIARDNGATVGFCALNSDFLTFLRKKPLKKQLAFGIYMQSSYLCTPKKMTPNVRNSRNSRPAI